ncbi:MAG: 4-hydroxy-3-methylbut-2-enyl diphosphate reductase [Alicyclobacillus sp.]|nr:4-hydroxy-3-methylbut-2-enyl diphosphate reductase [Alicyclobacillus sp.]
MSGVYLNTFAEGAQVGTLEEITEQQLPSVARTWKRSGAIVHYELYGIEPVEWKGIHKDFLVGDIGCAKIMLPVDPEFSALTERERPEELLTHRIAAVVEDYDLADEANPVLILNRKKAMERMQELNTKRVVTGGQAYGVIQRISRGGYYMNVGGYPALMPRFWYDWDSSKSGKVGEGFEVAVRMNRNGRIIVSRCHLLPNPFDNVRISRGARVRAKVTHIYRGVFKAEIRPGVRIRITMPTMYRLIHVGDHVMVEVKGRDKQEFYGIVV